MSTTYEEYFDGLAEGEEAMTEKEFNDAMRSY